MSVYDLLPFFIFLCKITHFGIKSGDFLALSNFLNWNQFMATDFLALAGYLDCGDKLGRYRHYVS